MSSGFWHHPVASTPTVGHPMPKSPSATPGPGWLCHSLLALSLITLVGCGGPRRAEGQRGGGPGGGAGGGPTPVDVAIARTRAFQQSTEYSGTTQPYREVFLRSQVEGQLLSLAVDVGDRIQPGQVLARLDDAVLTAAVVQAQAELAARESEVARAKAEVSDARTRVKQTELELAQARSDAARLQQLYQQGAITAQTAEQAQTRVGTAEQAVRSAQEQVRTREKAVVVADRRVVAQQAVVEQARKRQSFAVLSAPISGSVLQRTSEPGNLVQPGGAVLRLGDFSQVKIGVQVSELELAQIRLGQTAQVRLDALPNQELKGLVSRISPAADPTSRLVPIEITMPNRGGRIGSGLLARVRFGQARATRVVVPQTALQEKEQRQGTPSLVANRPASEGILFVVDGQASPPKVSARSVQLGNRLDGQVEILAGLKPGERFVIRSGQPLKDGDPVRLSILSEQ